VFRKKSTSVRESCRSVERSLTMKRSMGPREEEDEVGGIPKWRLVEEGVRIVSALEVLPDVWEEVVDSLDRRGPGLRRCTGWL